MNMPPVRYEVIELAGGLDLVTPTLALAPGVVRDALNFEVSVTGGYSRIAGYERFDGRPLPSKATYSAISASLTTALAAGTAIAGAASGATGVVAALAGQTVVLAKANGAFQAGETLRAAGVSVGAVLAAVAPLPDADTAAAWTAAAADIWRADIGPVPGSGPVRGVVAFGGRVYAWRDNVAGTAMAIHASSPTGWQPVALGWELAFTAGVGLVAEGATVTGATSGATGVVARAVLESGAWGSNAAGRLILSATTGTFAAGEALRVAGVQKATATGAASAITLAAGGRVDTAIANFGGSAASLRVYGADGVNRGFEFDGAVYVPIRTGMADDRPRRVAAHKNHLMFTFGASLQHSAPGSPYVWSPVLGAAELALGEEINELIVQPGTQQSGALAIYTTNNTFILYGTGVADWNLVPFNIGTGAVRYSGQNLVDSYVLDSRGVMSLSTSLNYGNFDTAALTLNIRPFVQQRRALLTDSTVNREKSQYRLFFSDGAGLYLTIVNGKYRGAMPVQFPDPVACVAGQEPGAGAETAYFGSINGFVYVLDSGPSFDGKAISAYFTLTFDAVGNPRLRKRFRKASLEVSGTSYAAFQFGADLGYGTTDIDQPADVGYALPLAASFWDSATWDRFVWDGRALAPAELALAGTETNIAARIVCVSARYEPFTVNSLILHYTPRRGVR